MKAKRAALKERAHDSTALSGLSNSSNEIQEWLKTVIIHTSMQAWSGNGCANADSADVRRPNIVRRACPINIIYLIDSVKHICQDTCSGIQGSPITIDILPDADISCKWMLQLATCSSMIELIRLIRRNTLMHRNVCDIITIMIWSGSKLNQARCTLKVALISCGRKWCFVSSEYLS